jgi:hypothetical protein
MLYEMDPGGGGPAMWFGMLMALAVLALWPVGAETSSSPCMELHDPKEAICCISSQNVCVNPEYPQPGARYA